VLYIVLCWFCFPETKTSSVICTQLSRLFTWGRRQSPSLRYVVVTSPIHSLNSAMQLKNFHISPQSKTTPKSQSIAICFGPTWPSSVYCSLFDTAASHRIWKKRIKQSRKKKGGWKYKYGGENDPSQGRYLTQTKNKSRQTSMPWVGFEPTICRRSSA
jgi:hypothetical protein